MREPTLDQRFADAMGQMLGPDFPSRIALAVSGGGDSMAMLALAHNWARVWGVSLWIVTVDHGLRSESAAEAEMVARETRRLGHPHAILRWHWDGKGNLQARAREARIALIDAWRGGIAHVLMAHTRDDVAETFLLRLARQAGVEGLAEMQRSRPLPAMECAQIGPYVCRGDVPPGGRGDEFWLHRPCLDMTRAELRHHARTLKVKWVDDPSNADPRFDRARMRALLPDLSTAGLTPEALVAAARHMGRAAEALRLRAAERFEQIGSEGHAGAVPTGEVLFDRDGFAETDRDTQMRLLSYALSYVASQSYRPREAALEGMLERLLAGGGGTLHGCEAWMEKTQLRISREYEAVRTVSLSLAKASGGGLWDGRWLLSEMSDTMRGDSALTVRALGAEGLAQCQGRGLDRAAAGLSFRTARVQPAIWHGDMLVACPALGPSPDLPASPAGGGFTLRPMGRAGWCLKRMLLSH